MDSEGQDLPAASGPPDAGSPAPSGADLRGAPRFALLLRVAKLVVNGRERFCVIRDASATGLKVRLFAPLPHPADLAGDSWGNLMALEHRLFGAVERIAGGAARNLSWRLPMDRLLGA